MNKPGAAAAAVDLAEVLEDDDEPTQVTKLIAELQDEGRRARQEMDAAVGRAERKARRRRSYRNLQRVIPKEAQIEAAAQEG